MIQPVGNDYCFHIVVTSFHFLISFLPIPKPLPPQVVLDYTPYKNRLSVISKNSPYSLIGYILFTYYPPPYRNFLYFQTPKPVIFSGDCIANKRNGVPIITALMKQNRELKVYGRKPLSDCDFCQFRYA